MTTRDLSSFAEALKVKTCPHCGAEGTVCACGVSPLPGRRKRHRRGCKPSMCRQCNGTGLLKIKAEEDSAV